MKDIQIPAYLQRLLDKYKYVLPVLLVGMVLLFWPAREQTVPLAAVSENDRFDTSALEIRLQTVLESMEGVGKAQVILTVAEGEMVDYAYDRTESRNQSENGGAATSQRELVTLSESGGQSAVELRRTAPIYRGAAVVCQGGDSAGVRLAVTQVIQSLTGISADRIVISKMKQ